MAGYTRQDISNEIDTGQTIKSAPLDAEFDALVAAFSAASGHKHNGSAGEGAPITVVGPTQNVGVSANSITPSSDNVVDLGSSTLEFKDLWIDGTANIDLLTADAGTVAGAAITTVSNTQTLTGKTINLTDNTLVATSAQVAAAVTDETGTGALVFAGSPALTGVPTAPTAAAATNTTQLATTAHVFAERTNTASLTNKTIDLTNNTLILTSAQLAAALTDETGTGASVFANSPALTGTPTAPTAVAGTNTTQVATTAHVFAERSNTATLTNKTLTSPTISGGSITGITDLAVADGGTGASDAATARTNLGAQAADATLTSISALGTVADRMIFTTGVDTWAETPSTTFGRSLMDDADATAGRTTLGLGTMATQNAATVTITGGSITGITDLAVADGGTGASDAATARTNLGLVIGTNVQAQDAELSAIAGLVSAADRLPYFTGSGTAALATFTAAGRALVDDADATAQLTTLGISGDIPALEALAGTGLAVRTGTSTWTNRTITAGNGISITNGDGVAGNPVVSSVWTQVAPVTASGAAPLNLSTTIPSGVSEVNLFLNGVSLSGTDHLFIQLGTSGGFVTTGYVSQCGTIDGTTVSTISATSGFTIFNGVAGDNLSGVIHLVKGDSDMWFISGGARRTGVNANSIPIGSVPLGGALTQIRLNTSGNTFDAGTAYVAYR